MNTGSIIFSALASGSNANCTYVESDGTAVLVDCGMSGVELERRLTMLGRDMSKVDAILVSHEHRDHASGVGVVARRHRLPVFVTPSTFKAMAPIVGNLSDLRHFSPGDEFAIGGLKVHAIPSPHDAVDPVVFAFDNGAKRFGVFTDIGFAFRELEKMLCGFDGILLESNHDTDMLRLGPYPDHLKRRIRGRRGHLSNREAARLVCDHTDGRLKKLVLAHLSAVNNTHARATATCRDILSRAPAVAELAVSVARRDAPTPFVSV